MKVFISGSKNIKKLDAKVLQRLKLMKEEGVDFLIGDCCGADALAQRYFKDAKYNNVSVYANSGKPRNNVGNWRVVSVSVIGKMSGYKYYQQKDIKMSEDADAGYVIWDCKSRGSLDNIKRMIKLSKCVSVYLVPIKTHVTIKNIKDLNILLNNINHQKT